MDRGVKGTLSKFTDNTKLGGRSCQFPQRQGGPAKRPQKIRGLDNLQPYEI